MAWTHTLSCASIACTHTQVLKVGHSSGICRFDLITVIGSTQRVYQEEVSVLNQITLMRNKHRYVYVFGGITSPKKYLYFKQCAKIKGRPEKTALSFCGSADVLNC